MQLFTKSEMYKKDEKTRAQCKKFIEANLEDEKNTYPGLKQKLEKRRFIAVCQWLHLDAEDKQVFGPSSTVGKSVAYLDCSENIARSKACY